MTSAFLITLCLLLIVVYREDILGTSMKLESFPEAYLIDYPNEPMFDNYSDIKDFLCDCTTEKDLKTAYVRIIIFQGMYKIDSATFLSELVHLYKAKEALIMSFH